MKLHVALLSRLIDIPSDTKELRSLLDDLGLEVKGVEGAGAEAVLTIETLANRGDHLYALGVAREISARTLAKIKLPAVVSELPAKACPFVIKKNTDKCSRYALLQAVLPKNMSAPAEVRSVLGETEHPGIVDILNFVQLELGQPMHAFDEEKIEGEIRIELSDKEETVVALDGKEYKVPPGSIVIRDRKKTVAIGGVIGCANSMVTERTEKVLLESAAFDPVSVRLTARGMGISTDASYAFERGSDREAIVPALKRVSQLLKGSQGSVSEGVSHLSSFSISSGPATESRKVTIDPKTIRREMNLPKLNEVEIRTRFQHLGYGVVETEDKKLSITVPSWRLWDVEYDADLVEDFVRSHGMNNVKLELPEIEYTENPLTARDKLWLQLEPALLGNGFYEVITEPFYGGDQAGLVAKLAPDLEAIHVKILNAKEGGFSHLKVTNLLHLADVVSFNERRGVTSIKIFERGRVFALNSGHAPADGFAHEREVLTLAIAGRWYENEFRKPQTLERNVSLTKGVLESVFASLGRELVCEPGNDPLLHPGQQAKMLAGREVVGKFGVLHPELHRTLGLTNQVIYAELDVVLLERASAGKKLEAIGEFPAIRRDITVRIPKKEFAARYSRFLDGAKLDNLKSVVIVDDFAKEGEPFRRVSYRLTFQNPERTLEHAEVDSAVARGLELLRSKHGVELA